MRGVWCTLYNVHCPVYTVQYTVYIDDSTTFTISNKEFLSITTSGSLLPYLPVFYRSIGLSAEQTGFVIAIKSLIGGAGCIFWGAFADKFKVCLSIV